MAAGKGGCRKIRQPLLTKKDMENKNLTAAPKRYFNITTPKNHNRYTWAG